LDQLLIGGQCAARPKGNDELATLRAELLSTYLDGAVEKYRFHIWWCPCNVADKDITRGQRKGTFSCRIRDDDSGQLIKFLSLKETEERLRPATALPTLRNATSQVRLLAAENTAMLTQVVAAARHACNILWGRRENKGT
jgi:hypothetical protein